MQTIVRHNSRPIGAIVAFTVVSLMVGMGAGFVAGHLKGKSESALAVRESKATAEKAIADLSIEQERKVKLQGLLESQKEETRKTKAESQDLLSQIAAFNEERKVAMEIASTAAKKPDEKKKETKRTYLGELEAVRKYAKKLIEEEPAKTESLIPNLSQQSKEMLPIVYKLRADESYIESDGICNSLIAAGFAHVFYAHAFNRSANDDDVQKMLYSLWSNNPKADEMAITIERYNLHDMKTKIDIRIAIKNNTKPYAKKSFDAVKMVVGDKYFSQMKQPTD